MTETQPEPRIHKQNISKTQHINNAGKRVKPEG